MKQSLVTLAGMLISGLFVSASLAADNPKRPKIDTADLSMELIPRTPNQMMAFYEGREFPEAAIKRIAKTCYFTVIIKNKRNDILWLEPNKWRFTDKSGYRIRRLDQKYWRKEWERLNIPMASRSTFGWTLLPDIRDLRPGEHVGGNIVIEPTRTPFNLEARFYTGAKKGRGGEVIAHFEGLKCARD